LDDFTDITQPVMGVGEKPVNSDWSLMSVLDLFARMLSHFGSGELLLNHLLCALIALDNMRR